MVKRVVAGIIICLAIAMGIAWVEGLGLGTEEVEQAFDDPNLRENLTKSTLGYLLIPYSLYSSTGTFIPIFAWAAGGFVAGLVSKSSGKGVFIGLVSVGIAWLALSYLSGVLAGLSFTESISALTQQAEGIEQDLIVAVLAAAVPGYIGGTITSDQKVEVVPMSRPEE